MNRRILCYGDSNTWGVIPRREASPLPSERYDEQTRWPCVMASRLGTDWTLIEEGLGGRTTMYQIPGESYRLGDWYLHPCLLSHRPLDYVVLMLGTNDLQPRMHETPLTGERLGMGMIRLIQIIRSLPECGACCAPAGILIIAPPPIRISQRRPDIFQKYGGDAGIALSHEFARVYRKIAADYSCGFLDASLYAAADDSDGVHFTRESHPRLGEAVAAAIQTMDAKMGGNACRPTDISSLTMNIEM